MAGAAHGARVGTTTTSAGDSRESAGFGAPRGRGSEDRADAEVGAMDARGLLTNIRAKSRGMTVVLVAMSFLALALSYAALVLVEVYSKRSSIGCPYPVYALTWCLVAVIQATVHAVLASQRRERNEETLEPGRATSVQGADEAWPVQLAWAFYYIVGMLVFTSIMAVTVLELAVWVIILFAVTGASKLFALYICLLLRFPVA